MSEYDLGQYDEGLSDLDTILDNGTLAGSSSKYIRQARPSNYARTALVTHGCPDDCSGNCQLQASCCVIAAGSGGSCEPSADCAQVYTGGKACDITGRQRETEVHYVCSAEGKEGIKSIREHATCQYTLVFATPRLCKHPGFHVAEQPVHTMVCSQLGGSQRGDDTEPAQQWDMEAEAEGALAPLLCMTPT